MVRRIDVPIPFALKARGLSVQPFLSSNSPHFIDLNHYLV